MELQEVCRTLRNFARKWAMNDVISDDIYSWSILAYYERGAPTDVNTSYLWHLTKTGWATFHRKQRSAPYKEENVLFNNDKMAFHEALEYMYPMRWKVQTENQLHKIHEFWSPELKTCLYFTIEEIKGFRRSKNARTRNYSILMTTIPFFMFRGKVYHSVKAACIDTGLHHKHTEIKTQVKKFTMKCTDYQVRGVG